MQFHIIPLFIAHLSKWGQAGSCCQAVDNPEGKHPWKKLVSRIATQWEYLRTLNANHANSRAKGTTLLSSISNAIKASTPLSPSLIISSQISRFNSQLLERTTQNQSSVWKKKLFRLPFRVLISVFSLHLGSFTSAQPLCSVLVSCWHYLLEGCSLIYR